MMNVRESLILKCLENWTSLNQNVNRLSEDECEAALLHEVKHKKRKQFIIRIHARFCKLRTKREREIMLTENNNESI